MSNPRLRAAIAAITIMALVNVFQLQAARSFELKIPNPLGLLLEGIGVKTYKLTPAYDSYIKPYIRNADAYDRMMNDYARDKRVSEKAGIRLIILLGIVRKQPAWLNAATLEKIARYYPLVEKKTDYPANYPQIAEAGDLGLGIISDASRPKSLLRYAQAVPADPALLAAALSVPIVINLPVAATAAAVTVAALVVFGLNRDEIFKYLTPEAQAQIVAAEDKVCANIEGGCTRTAAPSIAGSGRGKGNGNCVTVTGKSVIPGTLAFVRLDKIPGSRPHYPYTGDHYHYTRANQRPDTGKCYWNGDIVSSTFRNDALSNPEPFI